MKKSNKLKLAALTVCCVAVFVSAYIGISRADSSTTDSDIEILDGVVITENNSLDFGAVVKPALISVVKMSTAGSRTLESGDATLIPGDAGNQADYDLTSDIGETVELSISNVVDPDANIVLTPSSFKASVAGGGDQDIGAGAITFTSTGTDNVDVGAEVSINPAVTTGEYTGTFDLNADYQ